MPIISHIGLSRIELLRQHLNTEKIDALLVSNHNNILYLTGFKGLSTDEREAWVFITKKNTYLITDGRYVDSIQKSELAIKMQELTPENPLKKILSTIINNEQINIIGFEAEDLSYHEYTYFKKHVHTTFQETRNIIGLLRIQKDKHEIEMVKKSCEVADQCLKEIFQTISPGQTEKEIAFTIEFWLKKHDSDLAFSPIVAIDQNSAIPHYDTKSNGTTKVTAGSIILIDFGALYNNYMSDITRMIFVGKPLDEYIKAYEIVQKAQEQALKLLETKSEYKDIDKATRNFITQNNYPSYPHSTGHGLGLEVHENPKIAPKSKDIIKPGHVVTIEPGVYVKGKFGIRIEDTLYINDQKQPEILTNTPKELLIIH